MHRTISCTDIWLVSRRDARPDVFRHAVPAMQTSERMRRPVVDGRATESTFFAPVGQKSVRDERGKKPNGEHIVFFMDLKKRRRIVLTDNGISRRRASNNRVHADTAGHAYCARAVCPFAVTDETHIAKPVAARRERPARLRYSERGETRAPRRRDRGRPTAGDTTRILPPRRPPCRTTDAARKNFVTNSVPRTQNDNKRKRVRSAGLDCAQRRFRRTFFHSFRNR